MSEAQQRNTAIQVAGIYQLNRFNALLLNYNQSVNATTTALNSNGSAQREQDRFNESLQARLNRLNTAWSEFANTVGQSVLSDGIQLAVSGLEGLTSVGSRVTETVGALPVLFATIGAAAYALSPAFRTFTASVGTSIVSLASFTVTSQTATSAVFALGGALRTLGGLAAVTALIGGIGFGISRLTESYAANARAQEQFRERQEDNIQALTQNRDEVETLISELEELRTANGQAFRAQDADLQQRFLDIQNRLAEVYPSLIEYIDESGNAHIRSNEGIQQTIASTETLIQAQNELAVAQARANFADNLDQIQAQRQAIELLQQTVERDSNRAENGRFLLGGLFSDSDAQAVERGRVQIAELQLQVSESSQEIRENLIQISELFSNVEIDEGLSQSIREILQNLNFSESLDAEGLRNFSQELGILSSNITEALQTQDLERFNILREQFNNLISPIQVVNDEVVSLLPGYNDLIQLSSTLSNVKGGLISDTQAEGQATDDLASRIADLVDSYRNLQSAEEQLVGVSSSGVESVSELIFLYETLGQRVSGYTDAQLQALSVSGNLTIQERAAVDAYRQRQDITAQLVAVFPRFAALLGDQTTLTREQTNAIMAENEANGILLTSYGNLRDGAYNSEQQRTLTSAEATRQRISFIQNEIRALEFAQRAYQQYAEQNAQYIRQSAAATNNEELQQQAQALARLAENRNTSINTYTTELNALQNSLNGNLSALKGYNAATNNSTSATKGSTASKSENNTVTRTAKFVTDQQTEALEKLNVELAKQQSIQDRYNEGSTQYLNSITATRNLEQQRLDILRAQESSLRSQIAAGNLVSYGVVDTTVGGNTQSASVTNAQRQQALSQARSDLRQLQIEITQQEVELFRLQNEVINATLAAYNNQRQQRDNLIAYENVRLQELDTNSARYGTTLQRINNYLAEKQSRNRSELAYLNDLVSSGNLYGQNLREIENRITELTTDIASLNNELQANNLILVQNAGNQVAYLRELNNFELSRLTAIQEQFTEGSAEYLDIQRQRIALQQEETRLIREQRDALQDELLVRDLSGEGIKEIEADIRDLSLAYYESINLERQLTEELQNIQTSQLNDLADRYISAYRDAIRERREDFNRQIDLESRREEQLNRQRLDAIEAQRNAFRSYINERLDLLNREESQRSFDENIQSLTDQQLDLQNRINLLSLDNSSGANRQRRDLERQLDEVTREINNARRDRELELQRQSYQDLLDANDEQLDLEQQTENERYEVVKNGIDAQREYWNQYYEDLANDERMFAQIREEILAENFGNVQTLLNDFLGDITSTLPELENDLDGTMQAVGTAIRLNVIDNLQEVLDLINQISNSDINTGTGSGGPSSGGSGSGSGGSSSTLRNSDLQVLLGKYIYENLSRQTNSQSYGDSIRQIGSDLAAQGRSAGSSISSSRTLQSYLSGYSDEQIAQFANYVRTQGPQVITNTALRTDIENYAARLLASSASLNTGGRINTSGPGIDGIGGRSLIVHPDEIVSSAIDSERLLEASNILSTILPSVRGANLQEVGSTSGVGLGDIVFNVENLNGTVNEARGFVDTIDRIRKTRFGG